ncbi:MAG: uridine kinase family protein [Lachnospiraceae bacterium]
MMELMSEAIKNEIFQTKQEENRTFVVAIDGRCASGKTTISKYLEQALDCNVIHMDDFFLPHAKRMDDWMDVVGSTIEFERLTNEILKPSLDKKEVKPILYRAFDCKNQVYYDKKNITSKPFLIIEGAYSHFPELEKYYDLKLFLDVTPYEQQKRILKRNGKIGLEQFNRIWIPLEEMYFKQFQIRETCEKIYYSEKIDDFIG